MSGGRVLVVEDEPTVRKVLQTMLSDEGFEIATADDIPEAVRRLESFHPDVILTDLKLPSGEGIELVRTVQDTGPDSVPPPVIILTAFGSIESAVKSVRLGVYDYLTKPFEDEQVILTINRAIRQRRLQEEVVTLRSELHGSWGLNDFPTVSPGMHEVLKMAREVALNPATTVLIQGESGTGKEVLARAIHNDGKRRAHRFVAIHCAAVPDTLIEDELFGHEKGAFTGAIRRKTGKLESADGGTVFLDEVGDMAAPLQVKLLRVLQERSFERLGGLEPVRVDVRIIAASHRNLGDLVRSGQFREDLYYRLGVFPLTLPPLRERSEDIEFLAKRFLAQQNFVMGKAILGFTTRATDALHAYRWPGNIRELQNTIERAVIRCDSENIDLEHLLLSPETQGEAIPAAINPRAEEPPVSLNLKEHERSLILRAMSATGDSQSKAARILGISRWQLRTKLIRHGIRPNDRK